MLEILLTSALSFVLGVVTLWICSFSVNTPNANIRTAAIYNGVMIVPQLVLAGLAFLSIWSESEWAAGLLIATMIIVVVFSFWFMMRLYQISFLAALWLVFAVWAMDSLVEKLF